ncbi:MAG: hypothetical protein K2Q18_12490 [Bdellovibrionales bacterium]|nr:hypothetical protein [Bdellovibrionales bacterium]
MIKVISFLLLIFGSSFASPAIAMDVNLPTESFLSFKEWKEEIDGQMRTPNWENIKKERGHRELVGRLYQCVGSCRIDRGDGFFNGSYRTGIREGDEIQTIGDSYAWIFLFDGTMVRMSPHSSVTFNELNIGEKENFINARVNAGNVLWVSRNEETYLSNNLRETDVVFFPYAEYDSLPVTDIKEYREDNLFELLTEQKTQTYQYEVLNGKIESNNKWTKGKRTYAFIVMPNSTLMGYSPNVEVVVLIGGNSYLKNRSMETMGLAKGESTVPELYLQLRGFENKDLQTVEADKWFSIDDRGRNIQPADEVHWLNMGEFITKRIPSIMLAREIFMKRYSEFAFDETSKLAKENGYLVWGSLETPEGKEKSTLSLRLDFLKEYFRRIETSNLLTNSRFREKLKERGETAPGMEYGNYFFVTALNRYYIYGEKLRANSDDKEIQEVLNSTKKLLWKKLHGIR